MTAVALALGGLSALAIAPTTAGAATSQTTATAISTAKNSKLGTILVTDNGETVYALKPSKTKCTGKCLKVWPPVLLPTGVMGATAGTGVDASKLGTVTAANGALQISYAGKPLYWFDKDKAPGQVKGDLTDKWGKWTTLSSSGSAAASGSKSSGSSNTNAGTGGTGF